MFIYIERRDTAVLHIINMLASIMCSKNEIISISHLNIIGYYDKII